MPRTRFAGVQLGDERISFDGHSHPAAGARAHVEDRGLVVRPGTPLAWPVTVVARSVFGIDRAHDVVLVVEGPEFTFIVPCPAEEFGRARAFAAEVCRVGAGQASADGETRQAGPGFPRSQLRRSTASV